MWGSILDLQGNPPTGSFGDPTNTEVTEKANCEAINLFPAKNVISFPQGSKLIRQGFLSSTSGNEHQFNDYLHRELLNDTANTNVETSYGLTSEMKFEHGNIAQENCSFESKKFPGDEKCSAEYSTEYPNHNPELQTAPSKLEHPPCPKTEKCIGEVTDNIVNNNDYVCNLENKNLQKDTECVIVHSNDNVNNDRMPENKNKEWLSSGCHKLENTSPDIKNNASAFNAEKYGNFEKASKDIECISDMTIQVGYNSHPTSVDVKRKCSDFPETKDIYRATNSADISFIQRKDILQKNQKDDIECIKNDEYRHDPHARYDKANCKSSSYPKLEDIVRGKNFINNSKENIHFDTPTQKNLKNTSYMSAENCYDPMQMIRDQKRKMAQEARIIEQNLRNDTKCISDFSLPKQNDLHSTTTDTKSKESGSFEVKKGIERKPYNNLKPSTLNTDFGRTKNVESNSGMVNKRQCDLPTENARNKNFNMSRLHEELNIKDENKQVARYNSPTIQICDITTTSHENTAVLYNASRTSVINSPSIDTTYEVSKNLDTSNGTNFQLKHQRSYNNRLDNMKGPPKLAASFLCRIEVKTKDLNTCFMCPFSTNNLPIFIKHVGSCLALKKNATKISKTPVQTAKQSHSNNSTEEKKLVRMTDVKYNYSEQIEKSKIISTPRKSKQASNHSRTDQPNIKSNFPSCMKVCRDEGENLKLKIVNCKQASPEEKSDQHNLQQEKVSKKEDINNIDYQCPYCLRLFYKQSKMERHIERCAQLKPPAAIDNFATKDVSNKQSDSVKTTGDDLEFLSNTFLKRKSYIKALKSLKDDENAPIPKYSSKKQPKESNKMKMKGKSIPQAIQPLNYTENVCGNMILTCNGCNYVTYRKWDLERHVNEKHYVPQ